MEEVKEAISQENITAIKKWISKYDLNACDEEGTTLLHICSTQDKPETMKFLLKKGIAVNAQDKKGWTPLHCAAYERHFSACLQLLKAGADPTIQNTSLTTPVFYIARCKEEDTSTQEKALQECFKKGSSPDERNSFSESLLMITSLSGNPKIVEFLLQSGADVNALNSRKESSLFYAIRGRNTGALRLLLKYGINVNIQSQSSSTAMDEAKITQWDEGLKIITNHVEENTVSTEIEIEVLPARFPKFYNGMIFRNQKIWSFGGSITAVQYSNQFYQFDFDELKWHLFETQNNENVKLPQVCGHSLVNYENHLYSIGGRNSFQTFPDSFVFNFDTQTWSSFPSLKLPSSLCYFSTVVYKGKLLLFGGSQNKGQAPLSNQLYIFDFNDEKLTPFSSSHSSAPSSRMQHTATLINNTMYLFGGSTIDSTLNDLYLFDCSTMNWSKPDVKGDLPSPRHSHAACNFENKLYIYGGVSDRGEFLSDFFEFNPLTLEWTELLIPNNTNDRYGHSLVTDGTFIYVVNGGPNTNNILKINARAAIQNTTNAPSSPLSNTIGSLNVKSLSNTLSKSPRNDRLRASADYVAGDLSNSKRRKSNYDLPSPTSNNNNTFRKRTLDKDFDEKQYLSLKESSGTLRRTSSRPKKKKSFENLSLFADRIELLENYSDLLSSQISTLIDSLEKEMNKSEPFKDKNSYQAIKAVCSSIKEIQSSQPPKDWEGADLLNQVIQNAIQLNSQSQTEVEKKKVIEKIPFPRQYYESLKIPPKRIQPSYPKSENETQAEKETRSRNLVFNEILTTETDYVRDLAVMIGLYLKPLQNEYSDIVGTYEIKNMFKNVEQLWDVNNDLLQLLLEEEKKPVKQQHVGKIFVEMTSRLSIYNTYCANQVSSGETLEKLLLNNLRFKEFVDEVVSFDESNRQEINSYLIKPFQRITRYPLLLKELAKNTPKDWPDLADIESAIKAIDVVVKGANETKRINDKMLKTLDLQNRLIADNNPLLQSLHKFEYVLDFPIKDINTKNMKGTKGHLYLFEEMILIVQPKDKGQKLMRRYLFQTPAVSLHSDFKPTAKVKHPIEIRVKEETYVFDCLTPSAHTELQTALTNIIKTFNNF